MSAASAGSRVGPVQLEVFRHRFAAVAEEMGTTLVRTAFSSNIKERRDLSCAVFDPAGQLLAQAAHIPVHLGSMPLAVAAILRAFPSDTLAPGDMLVCNDPFRGGTHLPDVTLVAPVFHHGAPAFYVANRAHHADIGGMTGGSMPLAESLFQEGLVIPPSRLVRAGELDEGLLGIILANVRTPAERRGDFAAQIMANLTGCRRLQELLDTHGQPVLHDCAAALLDHGEALARRTLAAIPDGEYRFEDALEGDGLGSGPLAIRLRLEVQGQEALFDFSDSDAQARGGVNAVRAIALSAVLYVMRLLAGALVTPDAPVNAGLLRPVQVRTRPGTVVDTEWPAAVAAGNVETSQRLVDVILGALAQALPRLVPAASQGTMNNLAMSGFFSSGPRAGQPFAYYETMAGGTGGGPQGPGVHAVHSHMTNTLNTPAEALEYAFPLRVRQCAVRRGSGGSGLHPGGDGMVRELELLADADVTVLSERREAGPYGLAGGRAGQPGCNVLIDGQAEQRLPGKFSTRLRAGQRLRIETPGGGGWGA